eukprot:1158099-Pelagomonas_calceolata.AAC.10
MEATGSKRGLLFSSSSKCSRAQHHMGTQQHTKEAQSRSSVCSWLHGLLKSSSPAGAYKGLDFSHAGAVSNT